MVISRGEGPSKGKKPRPYGIDLDAQRTALESWNAAKTTKRTRKTDALSERDHTPAMKLEFDALSKTGLPKPFASRPRLNCNAASMRSRPGSMNLRKSSNVNASVHLVKD